MSGGLGIRTRKIESTIGTVMENSILRSSLEGCRVGWWVVKVGQSRHLPRLMPRYDVQHARSDGDILFIAVRGP